MSLRKKALSSFIWSASDKLVNQLGYLVVTIFIARLIGPESFGLVGMLTIFMLLAESVVSSGFSQALVQRSHKLTENDASTIFYVNLGWGILMYLLLFFCAPQIANFYDRPELVDISRVLFVIILINSLTVVARAKLTISLDFRSQAISNTLATLLSSIIGIYLAIEGYSYWAFVIMLVSKSIFYSLGLWFFCRWLPKLIFSLESFKSLFKFGSNLMFAGLVATFVNNLYVALIGRYFSATQVGYFTQATNLSNNVSGLVTSTLQGVTYPIMTSIKEDRNRLVTIYTQLLSITMLFSLPFMVGFAAIAPEFITLFLGSDWSPAIPVLVALCFARAITPISAVNMNILNAIGRSDLFLKIDLSKLPLTLGALFIALPYGIDGLAWAMVCTSFIAFFINAYYPGKLFDLGGCKQLKIGYKYIAACAIMFTAVKSINLDYAIIEFIIKIIVGAVSYFISLFILRDRFLFDQLKRFRR